MAWAVTIVLLEVPSGALADLIGRRRLVLISAGLMVIEMAVLCFVPLGNVSLVFCAFLVNRIISGVSEAAASGADEHWPMIPCRKARERNCGLACWSFSCALNRLDFSSPWESERSSTILR